MSLKPSFEFIFISTTTVFAIELQKRINGRIDLERHVARLKLWSFVCCVAFDSGAK